MAKKFLDYVGLQALWNKIKGVFATKDSLSKTDTQVNALVNTTRELTNKTTNLENTKLGKTETAVKANGVVDTHDGRDLKFRYGKEGAQVTEWYPMWEGNTLTCVQRELVKNDLGINDLATKANNSISTANSANLKAQQAINQVNSVNQDKITKDDLVFSLSGTTLTITKRY